MSKNRILKQNLELAFPCHRKIRDHHNIKDFYNSCYKPENKDGVDYKTYSQVMSLYFEYTMKELLKGNLQKLPRIGAFVIKGKKIKYNFDKEGKLKRGLIDWRRTVDLWERKPETKKQKKYIYYTNEHSDGYYYSFIWSKRNVHLLNKAYYSFKPVRKYKRKLAKLIFDGKDYPTLTI